MHGHRGQRTTKYPSLAPNSLPGRAAGRVQLRETWLHTDPFIHIGVESLVRGESQGLGVGSGHLGSASSSAA